MSILQSVAPDCNIHTCFKLEKCKNAFQSRVLYTKANTQAKQYNHADTPTRIVATIIWVELSFELLRGMSVCAVSLGACGSLSI